MDFGLTYSQLKQLTTGLPRNVILSPLHKSRCKLGVLTAPMSGSGTALIVMSQCRRIVLIFPHSSLCFLMSEKVKQLAKEYEVEDGPNDEGEMFERTAKPSDR